MTLLNLMLRERRVHILPETQLVSQDAHAARKRLREQMEIYSMQFKVPDTVFQRGNFLSFIYLHKNMSFFFQWGATYCSMRR